MRYSRLMLAGVAAVIWACGGGEDMGSAESGAAAGGDMANADPDMATAGNGLPMSYMGRTDRATDDIAQASYTAADGGMWEVRTGPHHIMWTPADSASGNFSVTAMVDQLEAAAHPEAYGIFVGGHNLDQPNVTYSYFVVRGTGEFLVRKRNGEETSTVVPWTAHDGIPKLDAGGMATHKLTVQVDGDDVHFLVNDNMIYHGPRSELMPDGIAGIRIGHNLHVKVKPVSVTR